MHNINITDTREYRNVGELIFVFYLGAHAKFQTPRKYSSVRKVRPWREERKRRRMEKHC